MKRRRSQVGDAPWNGDTRQADGLTVFCQDEQGHTRAVTRQKASLQGALQEITEQIDSWDGGWKITCISTPSTIWRDLKGHRRYTKRANSLGMFGANSAIEDQVAFPEVQLLARVDRLDLLAQNLRGRGSKAIT